MLFLTVLASLGKTPHPVVLFYLLRGAESVPFSHFSVLEKTHPDPSLNQPNLINF